MNELVPIPVNPYDPNLFLSTTAQATAALVAIIGGFLVSRLIGLVSEKTQQVQSLAELQSKRRVKDAELEKFNHTVATGIQRWFREDNLNDILEKRGDSNYTKMVDDFDVTGSDRQGVSEYANHLKNTVTRAFKELERVYKGPGSIPESPTKIRTDGIQIDAGHDEEVFQRVSAHISATRLLTVAEDEAREGKISTPENSSPTEPTDLSALAPTLPPVPPVPTLVTSRHDAAIKERDRLKEELAVIIGEIELLESRLPEMAQQHWLIAGFAILAYFSVVGIVYPLYLMTRNPVVATASDRSKVLLGFISGLIALLAFIWSAVADLRAIEKGVIKKEGLFPTS